MDETNELIRRNGMATAQSCYLMAQTLKQIGDLFAVANQPLPEPQKVPLVGDNEPPASEKRPIATPNALDESPDSDTEMFCPRNPRCTLGAFHDGECNAPVDERHEVSAPIATVEGPKIGKRPKNEFTAREWRNSKHFLQYMKQPEFSSWNAETQRVKGDAFVESIERLSPESKMNRWGDRFKKFHGLK